MKQFILLTIFAFISENLMTVECLDKEMTIVVNAKEKECFYERVPENFIIDIEYQVIDGGQGDLDINFELSVNNRIIFADHKKSDNIHRLDKPHPEADYMFCFDNTISHFNTKTVFFELIIEDPNNPVDENDVISDLEGLSPEEFYEMKVQDIQDIIHNVKTKINKARQLQDMLRSFEARDRNLAELNCSRVNWLSFFIVSLMIVVGLIQVYMIRSLFDTDPKGRRIWQKINSIVDKLK
ncbi:hypothetical protein PVAND_015135 [Polypedilum vanderplanki]|uniref:GOLD domain-containing protein n=1 Tax=Polypedilum vanderplanki TaxID=319348 RepID=A0A9J6BBR2_POLVA|nr:hypothetical protein PVAND_015135 [Polypedilum vanderplanki]